MMVLVHAFPSRMSDVFREWEASADQSLLELERRHLAVDEIGAGKLISRNWHLPACVSDVIRYRHDAEDSGSNRPLVEWISYCSQLAASLYENAECDIPDITSGGAAVANMPQQQIQELVDAVRRMDEQIRALASGLMQAE
jgi:hypothetical protein